jgi:hypothetical protein
MFAFIASCKPRNRVLALWGWLHVAVLLIVLATAVFEAGGVLGTTPWIRLIKFLIWMAMMLWTLARLVASLPGPVWAVGTICRSTSWLLLGVIAGVSLQSARGPTSNYQMETLFDTFVYLTLGVTIALAAVLVLQLLVLFSVEQVMVPRRFLWRIRFCLFVFLGSSRQGGTIVWFLLPLAVVILVLARRRLIALRDRLKIRVRPDMLAVTLPRESN